MPELPMFPLGTVLFPHRVLPLHVFEPRYRALMEDVMAGDLRFGVVLISHGHEVGGGDQRTAVGAVARVVRAEELEDGRWITIAVGLERLRVVRWLPDDPYPRAEVRVMEEAADDPVVRDLIAVVEPRVRRVLGMQAELGEDAVPATVELDADPSIAGWQLAVISPLTPYDAQRVLEADGWEERLALLDNALAGLEETYTFRLANQN